jgi:hypothetical protein
LIYGRMYIVHKYSDFQVIFFYTFTKIDVIYRINFFTDSIRNQYGFERPSNLEANKFTKFNILNLYKVSILSTTSSNTGLRIETNFFCKLKNPKNVRGFELRIGFVNFSEFLDYQLFRYRKPEWFQMLLVTQIHSK